MVFSSDGDFVNFKPITKSSILKTIDSQSIEVDSYSDSNGKNYFIYDQAVPNSSWVLRVNVPYSGIYGSFLSNALFPVFFFITVIISILIAYRQLRIYVVEPLEKLDSNLNSVFKNEIDNIEPLDSNVDIIENLNKSFILMQKGIEDRESNLQEFTYVASHDLQEPLRMITSYLRIIEMDYADRLDDEGKKYMYYVTDAAIRMKALIEDLLRYSRSGRIDIDEEVDLNIVLTEVIESLEYDINKTKTHLVIGSLPVVQGNHSSLKQVFQNLITNSLKFCDKTPTIEVWYENNKLFLKDNGIGMDENFIHKIFIAFQRLHNREAYPGTGIGLAIVKKVVEKHGWQILVNSKVGEGSTFIIDMEW